jgi:hypothetical protein
MAQYMWKYDEPFAEDEQMTFPSCPAGVNGKTRRNMNGKERKAAGRAMVYPRLMGSL